MDNKEQIKEFYKTIIGLDFEQFVKDLHNKNINYGDFGTYEEQLEIISSLIVEEYKEYEDFIKNISSSNDREELISELQELRKKMQYIEELKQEQKEDKKEPKTQEPDNKRKLLFATNTYGNVMVEKDLAWLKRNVDSKTYDSYLDLISRLENDIENFDPRQQKQLIDQFKDVYEVKDYQSRIYYRYAEDYIIIIGAMSKKDNFSKADRLTVESMLKNSEQYVNMVRTKLKNGEDMSQLEEHNKEILANIYSTSKKRGGRNE